MVHPALVPHGNRTWGKGRSPPRGGSTPVRGLAGLAERFRRNRLLAASFVLWAVALGVAAVGIAFLPEGVCDYDNHDAFVAAEARGGPFVLAAAALGGAATVALFVQASRAQKRRRALAALGGFVSLAASALLLLIAFVALIHFSCLD